MQRETFDITSYETQMDGNKRNIICFLKLLLLAEGAFSWRKQCRDKQTNAKELVFCPSHSQQVALVALWGRVAENELSVCVTIYDVCRENVPAPTLKPNVHIHSADKLECQFVFLFKSSKRRWVNKQLLLVDGHVHLKLSHDTRTN